MSVVPDLGAARREEVKVETLVRFANIGVKAARSMRAERVQRPSGM